MAIGDLMNCAFIPVKSRVSRFAASKELSVDGASAGALGSTSGFREGDSPQVRTPKLVFRMLGKSSFTNFGIIIAPGTESKPAEKFNRWSYKRSRKPMTLPEASNVAGDGIALTIENTTRRTLSDTCCARDNATRCAR